MVGLVKNSPVLLLDGEQRASLAAARSLGSKGIDVIVGSAYRASLAGSSRYVKKQMQYTSPLENPGEFLHDIQSVVKSFNIGMVLPITDLTMYLTLNNSIRIMPATVPLITYDRYLAASNKIHLMKLAERIGVPIPSTIIIEESGDLDKHLSSLSYPVILKPMSSLLQHGNKLIRTTVKIPQSREELINEVNGNIAFHYPYMIQEKVRGEGIGIFTLFDKGRPVTVFAHRRVREKPPWGGVSVVSESVEPDPEAKEYAMRLLEELQWVGPAMVEFKRDEKRGVPVLMEINARFWGSLQLAISSGVDFPYLLYKLWKGESIEPITNYRHTRMRWLLGDLDNLYISLRTNRSKLPEENYNKRKVIVNFIKEFFLESKDEVFRFDDARPSITELWQYILNILK